jgi:hypothetical protein
MALLADAGASRVIPVVNQQMVDVAVPDCDVEER